MQNTSCLTVKAGKIIDSTTFVTSLVRKGDFNKLRTPGGLSGVLDVLAEKNIDIMYLYAFVTASGVAAGSLMKRM